MGIYDRDYYRETEPRGFFLNFGGSVVTKLLVINIAVFVVDLFTIYTVQISPNQSIQHFWLRDAICQYPDTILHPLKWYQLLTYAFAHGGVWHLAFNMLALFFFGRDVEQRYGPREFLRFYLCAALVAGLAWATEAHFRHIQAPMLGASGAISAVIVLFACCWPTRTVYLFLLPVPAWLLVLFYFLADLSGFVNPEGNTAYSAHLGGAVFGLAYYWFDWRLSFFDIFSDVWQKLRIKMRLARSPLKVHQPREETPLADRVDAILDKISREGESSLTAAERKTLQDASKKYQQRRST